MKKKQPKQYRTINQAERLQYEALVESNILDGLAETVDEAMTWLSTPEAEAFFKKRNIRMTRFFRESGLEARWDGIIQRRAERGADIAEQIYDFARSLNLEGVVEYNTRERAILNSICDSQYELVRNTTQGQVQGIRRAILNDVAEGINPLQTSLKQVQLEPINGMSPTQRAEMIARTETARITNTATLEQYLRDGVTMVELIGGGVNCCEECEALIGRKIPIQEAMDEPCIHPNCRCAWIPVVE